jgi:hypothetical protein
MSGTTTVNVSGTFSEKQRPNNGLERVAGYLDTHRLARIPVVAYVEWHSHGETRTGAKTAVVLPAIEPGVNEHGGSVPGLPVQDGYPADAAGQIMWLLDTIRRGHGKGAVADTLFSAPAADIHGDPDDEELPGQMVIPTETRLGPDGEHVVPPASGEEIMAERAEDKANAGNARDADLRRRVTGTSEAPQAAFSGAEQS